MPLCQICAVPSPDFAVASVVVEASNRVRAATTTAGDGVDGVDWRDVLAPGAWSLALAATAPAGAPPAPFVRDVAVVPPDAVSPITPTPLLFRLTLDAALAQGVPYLLALASTTRSAFGNPTSTVPAPFVGPAFVGIASQAALQKGGDIAEPPVADTRGDLVMVDQLTAYRARILRMAYARKGSFAHIPDYGRGIEPKRTYSRARLDQEAMALLAQIKADPDTRSVVVRVAKDFGAPHITVFSVEALSRFSADPVVEAVQITAGVTQ